MHPFQDDNKKDKEGEPQIPSMGSFMPQPQKGRSFGVVRSASATPANRPEFDPSVANSEYRNDNLGHDLEDEEGGKHEVEYADVDDGTDSGKSDLLLRAALVGVAALTIISAVGFYLSKKPAASGNGRVSAFDAIFMKNSDSESDNMGKNPSDIISASNEAAIQNQNAYNAAASSSGTSTHFTVYADTFSAPTPVSGKVTEKTTPDANMGRPSASRTQALSETYSSKELGISFAVDPYWKASVSTTQNGKVLYFKNVGPRSLDTIVITRFKGSSVTTSDPKKGSVTYFYNASSSSWMMYKGGVSAYSGGNAEGATPIDRTDTGKSIFEGTTAAKTLIVTLGTQDFVIFNINSGGYLDVFDALVKSVRQI